MTDFHRPRKADAELTRIKPFSPGNTTLLFVDVQNSEITEEVMVKYPEYYRTVTEVAVPNQKLILDAARKSGLEVIYTVIESLTLDGRDRSVDHKLSDVFVPKGSPLAEVIESVKPGDDDIVLQKTSSGVFNSTNIEYLLRNLSIENVIVVGFLTDQCVDMAIRDGADKGFYMVCVSDACATHSERRHAHALEAFDSYCRVMTADEIVSELTNVG